MDPSQRFPLPCLRWRVSKKVNLSISPMTVICVWQWWRGDPGLGQDRCQKQHLAGPEPLRCTPVPSLGGFMLSKSFLAGADAALLLQMQGTMAGKRAGGHPFDPTRFPSQASLGGTSSGGPGRAHIQPGTGRLVPLPERFPPSAHPKQQEEGKAEQKPCSNDALAADPRARPGCSF